MERERLPAVRKLRARAQSCATPHPHPAAILSLTSWIFRGPVVEQVYGKSCVYLLYLTCLLPTQVGSHQDITEESFSLFWMLEPRIGIGEGRAEVLPAP